MTRSEIKESLKGLGKEIRELKRTRGPENNGHPEGLGWKQFIFRHRHIAYCLVRGRSYESIEQPRQGNEPQWDRIEKFQEEYREAFRRDIQEAV